MRSMASAPFQIVVFVMPEDIDEQNHVNNTVYLRWVQEVATAHWQALASSDAQERVGWVVLRHEIDYKIPACVGDEVVLRTWVGKATRITFERFTEIRRSRDDQFCPMPEHYGVRSMRKLAVQRVCRRKCGSSFRFEEPGVIGTGTRAEPGVRRGS